MEGDKFGEGGKAKEIKKFLAPMFIVSATLFVSRSPTNCTVISRSVFLKENNKAPPRPGAKRVR